MYQEFESTWEQERNYINGVKFQHNMICFLPAVYRVYCAVFNHRIYKIYFSQKKPMRSIGQSAIPVL